MAAVASRNELSCLSLLNEKKFDDSLVLFLTPATWSKISASVFSPNSIPNLKSPGGLVYLSLG
ncbi:hypothetical protein D3C76_1358870 [compost metagenome]